MAPILYMFPASPPVRTVRMVAKAIGVTLEEREVNISAGDLLQPKYLKLNPQHTVPILVDGDFVIWDSHAIIIYLASKYQTDEALYPDNIRARAIIHQRLHFESGVIFSKLFSICCPIFNHGKKCIDQADQDAMFEAYGFLERFLDGQEWVAGTDVTLADYSLFSSITTLDKALVPIDSKAFPNVVKWIKNMEDRPECEVNSEGLEMFSTLVDLKLNS